jgi:hypothetical protein
MTAHLRTCQNQAALSQGGSSQDRCFHVVIEARDDPVYWLHLEVPATAKFADLDQVLRNIWLECCGHLSAFRFPQPRQCTLTERDLMQMLAAAIRHFQLEEEAENRLMGEPVGDHFEPGLKMEYDYDFGSTTSLWVRVVRECACSLSKPKIRLLARNDPPEIACAECGKPATQICSDCMWDGTGALCDACAEDHQPEDHCILPLINSPRAGVCGYCGPSIEP